MSERLFTEFIPIPNPKSGQLLKILLKQEIFPLKDSYVAYFKRDPSALERNPKTVARLESTLFDMGLEQIFLELTKPIETNRQMGALFKRWIKEKFAFPIVTDPYAFLSYQGKVPIIFNASDQAMQDLASKHFGYCRNKGLDFIAKYDNHVALGEAKFLSDFGGHQNAQFEDAISTLTTSLNPTGYHVKMLAILDGVVYIEGTHKMMRTLKEMSKEIILSAIFLPDFLATL
ncbi:type II restriction endonuclease [Helicobacter suis]|uniref:type II restriction endonuclease n=1 Tax=Helicobacter suis TaxID=104628 RepID=UPI00196777DE|nr:type II restriction endonuclease [Helicobacter suis]